MEIIGYTITIILVSLAILSPVYLVMKGHGLFKSLVLSIPLCVLFFVATTWWLDVLPYIRLTVMGYDLNGINEPERLANVAAKLHADATMPYKSRFGVGWPVKAMFGTVFFVIPYIAIFFAGVAIWRKVRMKTPDMPAQTASKSRAAEL